MTQTRTAPGDPGLARRLGSVLEGEVRFDAFTRGLYSTDASHYQIEPLGVVFPKSVEDVQAVFEVARTTSVRSFRETASSCADPPWAERSLRMWKHFRSRKWERPHCPSRCA